MFSLLPFHKVEEIAVSPKLSSLAVDDSRGMFTLHRREDIVPELHVIEARLIKRSDSQCRSATPQDEVVAIAGRFSVSF